MSWTRLININDGNISRFSFDELPTFIAISHTWSDALFPPNVPFTRQQGYKAIVQTQRQCCPEVEYCWIDTICIDQNDPKDKHRQVPRMGDIYGRAKIVVIVFKTPIGLTQDVIVEISRAVEGAVQMFREETWKEDGSIWDKGDKRRSLKNAMDMLNHFTGSPWSTRVWTLQEFILGKNIIWIGGDLIPLKVEEELFVGLPDVCETLAISECIMGPYKTLYQYYRGMAGVRAGSTDRTRVMELLGNRTASLAVDEVYGTMAASGVVVQQLNARSKEEAWQSWWEQAIRDGHIRWALLPPTSWLPSITGQSQSTRHNCVMPAFSTRHLASSSSVLDKVEPFRTPSVQNGTVTLAGRWVGFCNITKKLGGVYQDPDGLLHRDITLILFASNKWSLSLRVARAFGGGRYSHRKILMIAQTLKHNYFRAELAVKSNTEAGFCPVFYDAYYRYVWSDFMLLQSTQMMVINECTAYLGEVANKSCRADVIIAAAPGDEPQGQMVAFDFNAKTTSDKSVLTVVALPETANSEEASSRTGEVMLHKFGVTIPNELTDLASAKKFSAITLSDTTTHDVSFGGATCWRCSAEATAMQGQPGSPEKIGRAPNKGSDKMTKRSLTLRARAQRRICVGGTRTKKRQTVFRRRMRRLVS